MAEDLNQIQVVHFLSKILQPFCCQAGCCLVNIRMRSSILLHSVQYNHCCTEALVKKRPRRNMIAFKMEDEIAQSSGDEAPEDVSHSESKNAAQERRKLENEAIKQLKDANKEKRRKREKKMKEQKQAKRERTLERLPDEIIEILSSVDKEKERMKDTTLGVTDKNLIDASKEGNNRQDLSKKQNAKEKANEVRPILETEEDVDDIDQQDEIDFDDEEPKVAKNVLKACVLNENYKSKKSKAEKGKKFLREQLYGDRITRVQSSSIKNAKAIRTARPKSNF